MIINLDSSAIHLGMIPCKNHVSQGSGEQGSVLRGAFPAVATPSSDDHQLSWASDAGPRSW